MVKDIRIDDFDYLLPDSSIPRHPLVQRAECKLLLRTPEGRLFHKKFKDLPDLLPVGSLMVCNDTKVINARLSFHKESGANIEIFLLEPILPSDYLSSFQSTQSCSWKCLVGNLKKWKEGNLKLEIPNIGSGQSLTLFARRLPDLTEGGIAVEFYWNNPEIVFSQILEKGGEIPIPPYLNRDSEETDKEDYQTVYAMNQGSVAAPTAGLHFTPEIFEDLEAHAVTVKKLTLHVGAGTFKPVKSDTIGEHDMHSERFSVSLDLLKYLLRNKKNHKPIVAVGTTSVRSLESIPFISEALRKSEKDPYHLDQWRAYSEEYSDFDTLDSLDFLINFMEENGITEFEGSTSIMIAPGFQWRITDVMVTNFHQPKSTLLLLVSSFLSHNQDYDEWKNIYEEALRENYRFLSYGDACLFIRNS